MFSRDVKRLSFRCQTLKFPHPNVKFYFSMSTAQREDVSNQQERKKISELSERRPTFNHLQSKVKELAQDYSFSEVVD